MICFVSFVGSGNIHIHLITSFIHSFFQPQEEDMFDEELTSIAKDLVESSDKDENEEQDPSLKAKKDGNSAENKGVESKTPLQPLRRSTRKSIKNEKL